MDITTLYVGQGALAVIRHGGETIVVDSHLEDAEETTRQRIEKKLDHIMTGQKTRGLVLTGFDADHAHPDGVDLILTRYKPDWVMYPKYYKDTDTATAVFRIIEKHEKARKNTSHPLVRHSVRVDNVDKRKLDKLANAFDFELFSPHIEDMDSSNNCSIVLKVSGLGQGGFSYLITGDTETDRWDAISRLYGHKLRCDVMAAPHHGSKNGAHAKTLLLASPNTILISAGVDNQYGHPDSQALKAFQAVAKHVYATNVKGGVHLVTKPTVGDFETQLGK